MIAASDPGVVEAARMFKARITNVLVGCTVGLPVLVVGGSSEWKLPLALAVSVLVPSCVIHIPAPITAAIVIAGGLTHHSKLTGVEHRLHKVAEVIFGCLVGLVVTWAMSKVCPSPSAKSNVASAATAPWQTEARRAPWSVGRGCEVAKPGQLGRLPRAAALATGRLRL
jgi:hypothetical protein